MSEDERANIAALQVEVSNLELALQTTRAATVEECAKVCEDVMTLTHFNDETMQAAADCARAIRALLTTESQPDERKESPSAEPVALDYYDAGYLNDYGGGNVGWWQDYIRAELGRAHSFYQSQIDAHPPAPDGMVLVPVEPTYQMMAQALVACPAIGLSINAIPAMYRAMLAAVNK